MAKQLWLTHSAATAQLGNNNTKLNSSASWWTSLGIGEARGLGASTAVATAAAGPTNGIEVVHSTSALPNEWITSPLLADFTIAGTITLNLWAHESANTVNASINAVIEKIDGATGAVTQIVKTARTTELGTSSAAANFTATPTSTACKRGDRIRIRVFADDAAANMGSSGTVTFTYNGVTAAASGDSWVQFTENLTFDPGGVVSGSIYHLTDTAASINPGSATEKVASQTIGSGAVNAITNTAAGPTAPIQITDSAGGAALEWYTPPLEATTIGGRARFNVRGLESNAAANASARAEIAIVNGDGSGAVVWASVNSVDEFATSSTQMPVYPTGDDTGITAGQRLRFRVYLEDPGSGPLVAGHTATVIYNGTTALQTTHVILPGTVTEQATGTAHTATPADTLALSDALASQAVFARTVTDPLTLADSQAFQRDVALPLADTLALADLVAAQRGIAQAVADTLALADLATTAAGKGVSLADTLALADAVTSQAAFVRGLADTLSLADTLAAQSAFQLSIVDTLALADLLASQAAFVRALADTLTLADLASPVESEGGVDHTQPIADVVALADTLTAGSTLARTLADTLALTDSLTAQKTILRDLADTVSLADTLRFGRDLGLADTVVFADTVSFQAVYQRALADTLSLVDSVTAGRQLAQTLADTLALIDANAFESGRGILLEDTIALADLLETVFAAAIGEQPPAGTITLPSLGGLTRASRGPRISQPTHGARTRADRGKTDTPRGGVLTKTARGDVT